jgi:superfamily II DNA helicase RecQ
LYLKEFRSNFSKIPCTALTATATSKVLKDIRDILCLDNEEETCKVIRGQFYRENIKISVINKDEYVRKSDYFIDLLKILNSYNDSGKYGIIYCFSRKDTEMLYSKLYDYGFKNDCFYYHAGLTTADRNKIQEQWMTGKYKFLIATVALGLGIDFSKVSYIIHTKMSSSLLDYFQEIGRAGRDRSKIGNCHIFYSYSDKVIFDKIINAEKDRNLQELELIKDSRAYYMKEKKDNIILNYKLKISDLLSMIEYLEDTTTCRHKLLSYYFGEYLKFDKCNGMCDNCSRTDTKIVKTDITDISKSIFKVIINYKSNISRNQILAHLNKSKWSDTYYNKDFIKILIHLQIKKYITEVIKKNESNYWVDVIKLKNKCKSVIKESDKIFINFIVTDKSKCSPTDKIKFKKNLKGKKQGIYKTKSNAILLLDSHKDTTTELVTDKSVTKMLSELHDETIKKKYKDESLEDEKKREERKKKIEKEVKLKSDLVALRKKLSSKNSVPLYCIFSNNLIDLLVENKGKIKSKEDLLKIKGIGKIKYKNYGDDLLKILS